MLTPPSGHSSGAQASSVSAHESMQSRGDRRCCATPQPNRGRPGRTGADADRTAAQPFCYVRNPVGGLLTFSCSGGSTLNLSTMSVGGTKRRWVRVLLGVVTMTSLSFVETQVHHVALRVADVSASKAWFLTKLRFHVDRELSL
jgi:hypothetical protein